ncbi:MAG: hypothetical protein GXP37_05470 [Chloroflexi bacterium]|nr:hypothetical protein [Chloroflexota bacterium]
MSQRTELLAWSGGFGGLYLLTALMGVWAAYDRAVAWNHFTLIVVSLVLALILTWAGRGWPEQAHLLLGLGIALVAGALAVYFLLTYDWREQATSKIPLLYGWGIWIQDHRPDLPMPEDINANVAASGLELLLPLGLGASLEALRQKWLLPVAIVALMASFVAGFALIISMSRGAWLGIAAGSAMAAYAWWRLHPRKAAGRWRRGDDLVVIAVVLALLAVFVAILLSPSLAPMLESVGFRAAMGSRGALWRDALIMIGDAPFTGNGLGATMMVHASYIMLIHVGFIQHMHNLFLEVAVQQGLAGALALSGLVVLAALAIRRQLIRQKGTMFLFAAIVSLTALVVHGMFDAALYSSRMVPLTFLPVGLALGLKPDPLRSIRRARRQRPLPFFVILFIIFVLLLMPATRAAFLADLGVVYQTRAELSVYNWPDWGIQDAVRRSPDVDLSPAIDYYQEALVLNPNNITANRRLGQIELSLGRYDQAHAHLLRAYARAPWQQANRFLLGESYAIAGNVDQAVPLWRTVTAQLWWDYDWIGPQLFRNRQWWYQSIGEAQKSAWIAETIARTGVQ